ncbi:MAG: septum formation protein Maf [Proteobacteria bacterium]|nr:septum formation protein Maf [Pseudomonadota bacterium]
MRLQAETPTLILASASSSRRALLDAAGLVFEALPAHIDEDAIKQAARQEKAPPEDAALLLARLKSERIAARRPDALVIGADQILVCEGEWFDKPADRDGAAAQLRRLRGREHRLVTAVLCLRGGQVVWQHVATPRLTMRDFSDGFLDAYLDHEGDAVLSSVGAYRLESLGMHLFDRIEGEHAAILGLPMTALLGFLRQHGVVLA